MKRSDLLVSLAREHKVQLIEPSDEIRKAYRKKSEDHLKAARILLESTLLEESVSMAYYSMYHSVMALFFRIGIKCENHAAAIIILSDILGMDARPLAEAKRERIDKQYYVSSTIARKDVEDLITTAAEFNALILDQIDRLTSANITKYRNLFIARITV
jgi:uncharacterized protein (UPF0332 family)